MTDLFFDNASRDHGALSELNARRGHVKARLVASQLAGDEVDQAAASAELVKLD